MNKLRFNFLTALLLLVLFGLYSCQDDVTEITDPPEDEVITTDSPIFKLLGNTTERDGSFDNILDGSSCTEIVLPVSVIVSGIEVIIDSRDDLEVIEELFEDLDASLEDLEFIFPITVIFADHTEFVIENEDQFLDLVEDCIEGGDDDDIECLDFRYPITISVFDTASNVAETIVLENDEQLHELLEDLDIDDLISLQYPITLILYDSSEITVNNNHELEDLIEEVKDACDEDDDNDYDDDDVSDREFVEILIEGKWMVDEFYTDRDKTELFDEYKFKFLEEGIVWAYNNNEEIRGEWDSDGDEGFIEFEIEFEPGTLFSKINGDWKVLQYEMDFFKLMNDEYDYSSNVQDSVAYLSFERCKNDDPGPVDTTFVSQVITVGAWEVARYEVTGNNETEVFNDFIIEFDENGWMLAVRENEAYDGGWNEGFDGEDQILFLDFGDTGLFSLLSDDWVVLEIEEHRIELKVYKENQQYELLVLERIN